MCALTYVFVYEILFTYNTYIYIYCIYVYVYAHLTLTYVAPTNTTVTHIAPRTMIADVQIMQHTSGLRLRV